MFMNCNKMKNTPVVLFCMSVVFFLKNFISDFLWKQLAGTLSENILIIN